MRVSFTTLGCRLNQSETALLERAFLENGWRLVPPGAEADVAVINSCTVTAAGEADTRRAALRCARANPEVRIAVAGCLAQVCRDELLAWPNVRWVVGSAEKHRLAEIICADTGGDGGVFAPEPDERIFTLPLPGASPAAEAPRIRTPLKIQDGCDHGCAYCEIPYARGKSRSRSFENILAEAEALTASGHRELVITGVNIADYRDGTRTLLDVIAAVEGLSGLCRVRLSSVEHTGVPLALTAFMRPPHKLCRFLHLPVQNGCDRILKRMGRGYTTAGFGNLLLLLVSEVPGLMIGTDIIVGFPGETADDFAETVAFVERMPFGYLHVFRYSPRKNARSRLFPDQVAPAEISRRSAVLRDLGEHKRRNFLASLIGTPQEVLFEEKKDHFWVGHTDNYVTIQTKSAENLRNSLRTVIPRRIDGTALEADPWR